MGPEPNTEALRRRRVALLLAGAAVTPYSALDVLLLDSWTVAAAGLAWGASLFLAAALQRPGPRVVRAIGVSIGVLGGVVATLVKVRLTGGTEGLFSGLMLALPLLVLLIAPDLPLATSATSLALLLGSLGLGLAEGKPAARVAYHAVMMFGVSALAVLAAFMVRRQAARDLAAERALAESERRRGAAERYAEVGRLAAAVSHEMNNPLASVAANLRWLGGADATDPEEERAVVRETLEGVDRLATVLREIRKISHAAEADEAAVGLAGRPGPGPAGSS